ncbi:MAG: hypothetical protein FWE98_04545 [Oscillospiraceae bacterium]|nr:hypothetical protein [Oscillospiraceae bacterium]
MIHNIPEPEISPNFTIDDIHKIREWNYERMKDATKEERRAESDRAVRWFDERIAELRRNPPADLPSARRAV